MQLQFFNIIYQIAYFFRWNLNHMIFIQYINNAHNFESAQVIVIMCTNLDNFTTTMSKRQQMSQNKIKHIQVEKKQSVLLQIILEFQKNRKTKMFFNRLTNFVLKTNQVATFEVILFSLFFLTNFMFNKVNKLQTKYIQCLL